MTRLAQMFLAIVLSLTSAVSHAANEEHFEWNGVRFCSTRYYEVLQYFTDSEFAPEYEILKATHSGDFLGAPYSELYFHIRPDTIVTGVSLIIDSGDISELESTLDGLARQRWADNYSKNDSGDALNWAGHGEGHDVHMHLMRNETTPFYNIKQSEDGTKSVQIVFRSITDCDRAKELPRIAEFLMPPDNLANLLETMPESIQPPLSDLLGQAIGLQRIDRAVIQRTERELSKEDAERHGVGWISGEMAQVIFTPLDVSETRIFKGKVMCWHYENSESFNHCQDESWTRLETAWMPPPIRFSADLSDSDVRQVYEAIDQLGLVSRTDGERVTSEKIYMIRKYPHAGDRINVYVTTNRKGFTDVIYLKKSIFSDDLPVFELSGFECGVD